jgi:uracil phosphoribosyltransferase
MLQTVPVQTPLAETSARVLSQRIALVPILRAGLGMVDAVLNLMPTAEVWHLGMYRDEATARPVEYYSKLPKTKPVDVGIVLDPMLATGGSAIAALGALREWGVSNLKLVAMIASRDGIRAVQEQVPEADMFVGAIDAELDARKFIVPGLGDAGDRIFNTHRDGE